MSSRLRDPKLRAAKTKLEEDIRALISSFKKEYDVTSVWFKLDNETAQKFSLRILIEQDLTAKIKDILKNQPDDNKSAIA